MKYLKAQKVDTMTFPVCWKLYLIFGNSLDIVCHNLSFLWWQTADYRSDNFSPLNYHKLSIIPSLSIISKSSRYILVQFIIDY